MLQDRIVAHRGYQKCYPENTLLAYRQAIAAGARCVETDILLSADLQPVLYHDPSLRRVSGIRGQVAKKTLAELTALPACEPQRLGARFQTECIPSLYAFAQLIGGHSEVTAYVEIKREAVAFAGAETVYRAVAKALKNIVQQVVLISFDYAFISHARSAGWRRCGVVLRHWKDLQLPLVQAIHPEAVFCNAQKIPASADLHTLTPQLIVYEIDDPHAAIDWFRRGVDKIESFDIGAMLPALAHRAL